MTTLKVTRAGRALRRKLTPAPALTQKDLAEKLDVTQQAISAWMRGIARPEIERRALIETLTGVPASHWDEDADDESSPDLSADDSGERGALTPEDLARAAGVMGRGT